MYANQFRENLIWPCSYSPRKPLLRWRTWLQRPRYSSSLGEKGGPRERWLYGTICIYTSPSTDYVRTYPPAEMRISHHSPPTTYDQTSLCLYSLVFFTRHLFWRAIPETWRFWSTEMVYDGCPVLLIFSAIRFTIRARTRTAVHYLIENNRAKLYFHFIWIRNCWTGNSVTTPTQQELQQFAICWNCMCFRF